MSRATPDSHTDLERPAKRRRTASSVRPPLAPISPQNQRVEAAEEQTQEDCVKSGLGSCIALSLSDRRHERYVHAQTVNHAHLDALSREVLDERMANASEHMHERLRIVERGGTWRDVADFETACLGRPQITDLVDSMIRDHPPTLAAFEAMKTNIVEFRPEDHPDALCEASRLPETAEDETTVHIYVRILREDRRAKLHTLAEYDDLNPADTSRVALLKAAINNASAPQVSDLYIGITTRCVLRRCEEDIDALAHTPITKYSKMRRKSRWTCFAFLRLKLPVPQLPDRNIPPYIAIRGDRDISSLEMATIAVAGTAWCGWNSQPGGFEDGNVIPTDTQRKLIDEALTRS